MPKARGELLVRLDEVNYFKTHLSEVNKRFVLEDIKNVRVELVKLKAYINSIYYKGGDKNV